MKKKIMIIALVLFLGLGFSCEDKFNEFSEEHSIKVENNSNGDDDEEGNEVLPGQHTSSNSDN